MIRDYSVYEMSKREKLVFYSIGYAAVFIVFYIFYHSLILSAVSGALIHWVMPYIRKHMAARRMDKLSAQFKDMLYSLSASVAAGRQMEEALIEAEVNLSVMYGADEPIMKELRYMRVSMLQNKESDKRLLNDLALRSGNEDINNFVQVYTACRSMGGDLEKVIGHTTEILADKMTIDREIKALTAQKKTEGRIISAMPLVMLVMLNIVSYSYIAPLYETLAGRMIMTAALGAMFLGMYLMERISEIEV